MAKLTISVKQNHIDDGLRAMCDKCPVALAVLDETNCEYLRVYGDFIDLDHLRYVTPPEVCEFMRDFDQGYEPKPFVFELSTPVDRQGRVRPR